MPLDEEFAEDLKSDVADLKHMGARWGGAISSSKIFRNIC